MGMKHATTGSFLLLLWLCACASSPGADLATNERLYHDSGYLCKLPGDRSVFVAPLADARQPALDANSLGEFPIAYDADARWERPIVDMVDDLLRREIAASSVFRTVEAQPAAADVVLTPTLVTFVTAAIEQMAGGRSLAEVAIRIQAHGPVGADGSRPELLDQVFGDRELTEIAFRTVSRYVLAGAATRASIVRALQGLDSKSIGRNGMPAATTK